MALGTICEMLFGFGWLGTLKFCMSYRTSQLLVFSIMILYHMKLVYQKKTKNFKLALTRDRGCSTIKGPLGLNNVSLNAVVPLLLIRDVKNRDFLLTRSPNFLDVFSFIYRVPKKTFSITISGTKGNFWRHRDNFFGGLMGLKRIKRCILTTN